MIQLSVLMRLDDTLGMIDQLGSCNGWETYVLVCFSSTLFPMDTGGLIKTILDAFSGSMQVKLIV
jgi:hypothetical protein